MRQCLTIVPLLLLSACGITTGTSPGKLNVPAPPALTTPTQARPINTINASILATDCHIKDESFTAISSLRLSTLLQIDSAINTDFNQDKINDNVVLVKPTSALTKLCKDNESYFEDNFRLVADISNHDKPIITDLGLDYINGARLSAAPKGFSFSYEIGQSSKCTEEAVFRIDEKDIYLRKIRTICAVPDSDIDWQERNLDKSAATLLRNVDLASAFDGLREVFFE